MVPYRSNFSNFLLCASAFLRLILVHNPWA